MMKFARCHPVLRFILLVGGSLSLLSFVGADSNNSNAQCVPGWEWSYNSMGQNPCEITAALDQACLGYTSVILYPLAAGTNYSVPQENQAPVKECCCNTVIYSLNDACALCQFNYSVPGLTWQAWEQFCDSVNVTQYPWDIPYDVPIPRWAYLNFTNPGFNATLAQAVGRDPEATQPSPSTFPVSNPTSASSLGSNPSQFSPSTSTPLNHPSNVAASRGGGSKTNVRAIAEGAVGGVAVLSGVAILALFFFKRRGARNSDGIPESDQKAYDSTKDKHFHGPPKLYDPADPSTFPSPPPDGSPPDSGGDSGGDTTNPYQDGRYNGNPELQSVSTYLRDA